MIFESKAELNHVSKINNVSIGNLSHACAILSWCPKMEGPGYLCF